MTSQRLVLVEDDPDLSTTLGIALERDGYQVERFATGREGLEGILDNPPDLVILDLNLPDLDGLGVCRELRETPAVADLPIIILTARVTESDRVLGLDLGADDYITKPFSLRELRSRIRALLRRRNLDGGVPDDSYADSRLEIDRGAMEVKLDGAPVRLTVREFELLWHLVTTRPRVASRENILERVWGLSSDIETRTVDVHVRALRKKLGGEVIETIIGAGYRFRGYS
ncbi:MAG: response regulator transcription factor [Acidobacteria bacterium]|jgi:DNA-binding response OmpR family regulator|nr:response regulator transcription factor [Acidobacteriota bacterium]